MTWLEQFIDRGLFVCVDNLATVTNVEDVNINSSSGGGLPTCLNGLPIVTMDATTGTSLMSINETFRTDDVVLTIAD